jgi:transcriptional regulator with XRE-family HTH domain
MEVLKIYELLRGEIAKQRKMKKLTNEEIGKMAGYKKSSVDAFMSGVRETERLAKAIANALEIEI